MKKNLKKAVALLLCLCMLLPGGMISLAAPEDVLSDVRILEPQVEYRDNPLGIEVETPRFSWRMEASERGQYQTAYRILVASSEEALSRNEADVWDSGRIPSDISVGIEYQGPQQAMTRYFWKVQVWDRDGAISESDCAWWETGLMDAGWSDAKWIGRGTAEDAGPLYQFTIDLDYTVEQTAFGLIFGAADTNNFYMWQVNGYRGTTALLRPHVWKNGGGKRIDPEIDISSVYPTKESMMNNPSHMTLSVDNGVITTTLNGIEVNTTKVDPFVLGKIGFRAVKTSVTDNERFYADNIVVKDGEGNILFEEHFDDASNPNFNGGTVKDGQLYAEDALFLQKTAPSASQKKDGNAAPMLRKTFTTGGKEVARARLYATAAGIYDFSINGQRVTDDYFNPGRTTLDVRAMYQTFDVTGLLQTGDNAIGAVIGNGWYQLDRIYYGDYHSLYAKLVIEYQDGSSDVIVTDESWKYTGNGPVLEDDFWQGETYDARLEMPGWDTAGFDDSAWLQAGSRPQSEVGIGEVVAQVGPTVKNTMTLPALQVTEPEENVFVYDFGQNFAGIVRVKLTGEAGQKIRLRYAEMLNDAPKGTRGCDGNAGTIYQANLRSAKNTDYYILKGDPAGETFEPSMVFHGFRYVEITGIDEPLPLDAVEGIVLTSLGDTTSTFESSNKLVNQLYSNTVWGQIGNFLSIPTDCPQRDERRGFTGDAQIFARTATYNMDVAPFLEKYMQDICDNQTESGAFPHMAPSLDGYNPVAGGWMDAGVIIPWQLYQQYGDKAVLEKHYGSMCRYMDHLVSTSTNYIRNRTQYGDWLNIGESTPNDLLDTSFCVYSSDLMANIAEVLGREEDVAKFKEMAENFRTAWQNKFVKADGTLVNGSQTGYALGLYFNIFKESDRNAAAAALVENIKNKGWHLSTGFCGVAYLAPALSSAGYHDAAYRLLEQETYPSWLYPVLQGATTVWERWNSYTLESGFGDAGMNSFNHYAYGSVMEWVFRYGVGIERDETNPGYKHIILQPTIGGSFSYMKGSYDSIYGKIQSGWTIGEDGAFTYDASVPANTTATLYLPEPAFGSAILESGNEAEDAEGVDYLGIQDGKAVFELSSGDYSFSMSIDPDDAVLRNVRIDTPQGVDAKAVIKGQEYSLPMDEMISGGAGNIRIVSNDPNYTFAYWGDGVFDVNPDRTLPSGESISYAAYFKYIGGDSTAEEATLTLIGEEGASALINGERVSLPYTGAFKKGTELVIDPVAPSGKTFSHWEGGTLLGNPAAVQLNGDISANAVFKEIRFESNLALGKKPSTNSNIKVTGANNWDISNLTDGVYVGQGYSSTLTQSEDASANPVWAEIDLEKDTA
ncbi:MAG: family 78 glycoside hydrolase catalytic domain, partial [Clostridiales bacterium]|nr:family 78 glycoside hydrolase catalytic domain [Clostridiales bacterium]